MPANLTQPYLEAEQRYREATSSEARIAALEEMITLLPKHKGTEKMHADLKSRLAKLRKTDSKRGGPARRSVENTIEREGAGQIVLVGAPNCGKSSIVGALTNAAVEVTPYPFATHKPVPGTMRYEDVRFQLVDTPSISREYVDPNMASIVRQADAIVLCVDLSSEECLDQPEWIHAYLDTLRLAPVGSTVSGTPRTGSPRLVPCLVAGTKADHPDAPDALELLREVIDALPIVPFSPLDPEALLAFPRACFDLFGLVRVYSKAPGKEPDRSAPFLLPTGATLLEFAEKVHLDFRARLSFARVWGKDKYDGQRVGREHPMSDGDVVELHQK